MYRSIKLLVAGVCFAIIHAPPQASAAEPKWIWNTHERTALQPTLPTAENESPAILWKSFSLDVTPSEASLLVVAESCQAEVFLNGESLGVAEGYGPAMRLEAGDKLHAGENVLAFVTGAPTGPSAVAALLTIRDESTTTTIASDPSWQAAKSLPAKWPQAIPSEGAPAVSFGALERDVWLSDRLPAGRGIEITPFDDYTQWEQAGNASEGPDPKSFQVAEDFTVERVRAAAPGEGSWISLTFDPQGRAVISREDRGLLRLDLATGELTSINDTLKECRGLVFIGNDLYANANESKALYRLPDANADGVFETELQLLATEGGVGHGRNDLALGPSGALYAIHGDSVDPPENAPDRTSPFREQRRGERTSEGQLLRIDPASGAAEIYAAGLRNPYGVAFNPDGEPFTYDADAEFDMGAPWYRPTRVHHLLSGADYGWRGVTGQWPPFYCDRADNAPAGFDIGKGSPTAVIFGTETNFPERYRRALFVLDWTYGRCLAVHMTPRGASYAFGAETFLKGRPLNVTDLATGPEGDLYFITGGRQTQSALYRVNYRGAADESRSATPQQLAREEHGRASRALRRELETLHIAPRAEATEAAWPWLASPDPALRHAARIAIEHQPVESWRGRLLGGEGASVEVRPLALATGLLSLARAGEASKAPAIVGKLNGIAWGELSGEGRLALLDAYSLCQPHFAKLDAELTAATTARLDALYPSDAKPAELSLHFNRRLGMLLGALGSPAVVEKTLALLAREMAAEQRLQHLFTLRNVRDGWTDRQREIYFTELRTMSELVGGQGMPEFQLRIKSDALASLPDELRPRFEQLLGSSAASDADPSLASSPAEFNARPVVKEWSLEDLAATTASERPASHDVALGKQIFAAALCVRCHRLAGWGAAVGPDLTSAASRYTRRDLLEAILSPSKVVAEPYRPAQIVTTDGRTITGQIALGVDYRAKTLRLYPQPLDTQQVIEIAKSDIESHAISHLSPMPANLLDRFSREEIDALLAFIASGGQ